MSEETIKNYYVYELIDPRDGLVFYVGKGKGNRYLHHEVEAIRGIFSHKCNKIRLIKNHGFEIKYNIVRYFEKEQDAYDSEYELIKFYGLGNLTNVKPGGDYYTMTEEDKIEKFLIQKRRAERLQELLVDRLKKTQERNLAKFVGNLAQVYLIVGHKLRLFIKKNDVTDLFLNFANDMVARFVGHLGTETVHKAFLAEGVDLADLRNGC